jgi:hypothetical protein
MTRPLQDGRWVPLLAARAVAAASVNAALCVAAAVCPAPAGAQGGGVGPHRFGLEAGKLWAGVEDALASPTRYEGNAAVVGASYRFHGQTWRLGGAVARAALRLTPAVGTGSTHEQATAVSLDAWVLRRLWRSAGGRWVAFVGPAIAGDLGRRRHFYRLDQSTSFDNAFLGLEAAGLLEMDAEGLGRIAGRVMVPVAGVSVRTPYTTLASSGPEVRLEVPPTFMLLKHRLDLRSPVGNGFVFGFLYEGVLIQHKEPLDLAVAWHRFGVELEFAWGSH